jgi:molecular chaperone GrpE
MSNNGQRDGGQVDDEQLLLRFAEWLRETRAEAERCDHLRTWQAAETPLQTDVGLYRLVEEFTALRHEVKLQTRSSRGLEEQSETLVSSLKQAIDALRTVEPREAQAAFSAGKALALALAELDDSLDRGRAQTEKVIETLRQEQGREARTLVNEFYAGQTWLHRTMFADYHERLCHFIERNQQPPRRATSLEALLDGYRLIQNRLTQMLLAEGILRIDAVGRPVDPERMVVIEAVDAGDLPVGVVKDELRRGYTWKGRLLRYAEVRATRRN